MPVKKEAKKKKGKGKKTLKKEVVEVNESPREATPREVNQADFLPQRPEFNYLPSKKDKKKFIHAVLKDNDK